MKRLGIFIDAQELEELKIEIKTSGMFLSGGIPMGDPGRKANELVKKYGLSTNVGIDPRNGEFCNA